MSLRNLLGSFKSLGAAFRKEARRVPAPTKDRRRLSLTLEALEDRLVPAPLVPSWPSGHQPIHHPGATWLTVTGVPARVTAGTSFAVTVTDYDVNTGAVASYSGGVALTENSGGYYGTAWPLGAVRLNNGVGTATVMPTVAGTVTLIADAGFIGYSGTDVRGESDPLVVNPGPATSLAITAPGSAFQGVAFAATFTAKDAWGNTATSYNQTITLGASDGQAVTPSTVALASGTKSANVTLRNAGAVDLTASAAGLTSGKAHLTVVSPISALSAAVGYAPGYSSQYLQTGSEVDITGQDFQPGAKVIFGNPGTTDPQALLRMANQAGVGATPSINSSGTWLSVNVPRYAVSGPIAVIDPDGTCLLSPQTFTVNNYLNTFAFNFQNFTFNITWGDVKGEFGGSQVDVCIPNPFGSGDTGVPSPVALGVWGIAAAALNGKGACFGMGLTSVLMSEYNPGWVNAANGLPANAAPTVFNLQQNDALTNLIRQKHLAQISQEVITNFLTWEASSHTAASIYSQISGLLSAGHHPIVSLEAGANHAVVAYALEPGPNGNGDYYIDVYDPNRPFGGAPNLSANLNTYVQTQQDSRIYVDPSGSWSFKMADGSSHSGSISRFGSLQVVPVSLVSGGVTFPGNFTQILTGGALAVIFGSEVAPSQAPTGRRGVEPSPAFVDLQSLSEATLRAVHRAPATTDAPATPDRAGPTSPDVFDDFGAGDDLFEPFQGSSQEGHAAWR
jgi:hypothetical protein